MADRAKQGELGCKSGQEGETWEALTSFDRPGVPWRARMSKINTAQKIVEHVLKADKKHRETGPGLAKEVQAKGSRPDQKGKLAPVGTIWCFSYLGT